MLLLLTSAAAQLLAAPCAAASRPSIWKVGNDVHVEASAVPGIPPDWRYVDGFGRERLFRGVNVVYKDPPWLPTATSFNTNFSWVADDAKLLGSMGFNLIRLGAIMVTIGETVVFLTPPLHP
jgi:hypothetical protein